MVLSEHYLDPGFEPGSPSAATCGDRVTIPLGHRVGASYVNKYINTYIKHEELP